MSKRKKALALKPVEPVAVELTVAQVIQTAFCEGYNSYSTPCNAFNSLESAWEESEAKRTADACGEAMSGVFGFPPEAMS